MNLNRFVLCGALALGLAGCPEKAKEPLKIDSTKAALDITTNTDGLANGVASAATFIGQTGTAKSTNESCTTSIGPDGQPGPTVCTQHPVDTAQPEKDGAEWLKKHLFNADRVNAALTTDVAAVFCLNPADTCTSNQKCVQALTAVQVCVKAQSFAENEYELSMLVGAQLQMNPFNLSIKPGYAKLETKLGDVKSAYEAFSTAISEPLPEGFPTRLEGRFTMDLTKVSESVISASVAVLDPIAMDLYPVGNDQHSEVRIAAAPALWAVTVDGTLKQVKADVDAKGFDFALAARNFFSQDAQVCPPPPGNCPPPPKPVVGQILMHLDGLSSKSLFDAATAEETLTVQNIGLGDATSKVQFKDVTGALSDLVKVDLNAAAGRHVDVTYVKRASGVEVRVTPSLDLLVDWDFHALMAQLPDLKGAALKAITEIKLSGAAPAVLFREGKDEIKIEAGTLSLDATGQADGLADLHLSVGPNQCLIKNPAAPPANSHPFAAWATGTCSP